MLHNTAVPTIVQGGVKNNQIPSSCELTVNGRLLPGISQEEYFRDIREVGTFLVFELSVKFIRYPNLVHFKVN